MRYFERLLEVKSSRRSGADSERCPIRYFGCENCSGICIVLSIQIYTYLCIDNSA